MRYLAWIMCMKPPQCEIPLKASFTDTQIRGSSLSGERNNLFALILGFRGQKSAPALNCVTLESYRSSGLHSRCASNGARLLQFTQRLCFTPYYQIFLKLKTPFSLSRNVQNRVADVQTRRGEHRSAPERQRDNGPLQADCRSQWTV